MVSWGKNCLNMDDFHHPMAKVLSVSAIQLSSYIAWKLQTNFTHKTTFITL